ncbi:MAG: hypothetical protein JSW66_14015 [Phycisphaerales bacterium]|nr:MAG: hypothetical protein JSW66_14015 [Phycisphaerales bacterium]
MILSKPSVSKIGCQKWLVPIGLGHRDFLNRPLFLVAFLSVALLPMGCRRDPQVDATAELSASFEGSPAKEDVMQANLAFEEAHYKDSLQRLHKVVSRGDLTERQKKAIAGIVGQVLQAVHEDPQLSADPQLHRIMELLIRSTLGEP